MIHFIRKPRAPFACATRAAALLIFVAATMPLHAQVGGEGPMVLRLPASARTLAMGNAGISSNDGDAMLYNPGMLSSARGAAFSMQRYGSNATAGAFGSVTSTATLTFGLAAQFLEWKAPAGVSYAQAVGPGASHLSDSGVVGASSTAFTIGVARTVKKLRLGLGVKYAEDRIGAAQDGVVAFDIGMTAPLGPGALGITVQNLGAGVRMAGDKGTLPFLAGIGYGAGLFPFNEYLDLGARMQLTVEGDGFVRPAGGIEVGYVPIEGLSLIARAGIRLPRERDEPLATGGFGITYDRFSLDYALEPMRGGRPVSHRVGIRVR